ncbi:MAG: hypothetical protein CMD65_01735 [Gammaproteobacteria bacterium]|nr:hypothetical protein [Gammaproteobacteria bacterium]|tara:strand:+ start:4790 stop:5374 length:585 start_codon:yes stop_codon:yes gene_type:complete
MNSINIFTKCPYTSECKTRLKSLLNKDERAYLSQYMLLNILNELNYIDNCEINLWVYPNFNNVFFKKISKKYKLNLYKQIGNNLSQRLDYCIFNQSSVCEKVLIIGSDIPTLNHQIINKAIKSLNYKKYVIGPSKDGGFYLLGTTISFNKIFNSFNTEKIMFSSLVDSIVANNHDYSLLDKLKDIDTKEDLLTI